MCYVHELTVGIEDLMEIKKNIENVSIILHKAANGKKIYNSTKLWEMYIYVYKVKHVENSNPRCMKLFYLHDFCWSESFSNGTSIQSINFIISSKHFYWKLLLEQIAVHDAEIHSTVHHAKNHDIHFAYWV